MSTATDDGYESVYHLYEPHKIGLPKQGTYWKELWQNHRKTGSAVWGHSHPLWRKSSLTSQMKTKRLQAES